MTGQLQPPPLLLASELIEEMARGGIVARLFGGAAIALTPCWENTFGIARSIRDIDLVVPRSSLRAAAQCLQAIGGTVDRRSLLVNDGRFLKGSYRSIKVDLYSDPLYLSHKITLGIRLDIDHLRLTPADLLATKLQIESGSRKNDDLRDVIALIASTPLSESSDFGTLNVSRICELCAGSWGFYYSAVRCFAAAEALLPTLGPSQDVAYRVTDGIAKLSFAIENTPKSWFWKLRRGIGPRVLWYEVINS